MASYGWSTLLRYGTVLVQQQALILAFHVDTKRKLTYSTSRDTKQPREAYTLPQTAETR